MITNNALVKERLTLHTDKSYRVDRMASQGVHVPTTETPKFPVRAVPLPVIVIWLILCVEAKIIHKRRERAAFAAEILLRRRMKMEAHREIFGHRLTCYRSQG